jgi:hypothetical protein
MPASNLFRFLGGFFCVGLFILLTTACDPDPYQCNEPLPDAPLALLHPESEYAEPGIITFEWQRNDLTCPRDHFELIVWDCIEPGSFNEPNPPGVTATTRNSMVQYPTPLDPGKQYCWQIRYVRDVDNGPDILGHYSRGYLYTGPLCSTIADLQPLEIANPPNNMIQFADYGLRVEVLNPNHCHMGHDGEYHLLVGDDPNLTAPFVDSSMNLTDHSKFEFSDQDHMRRDCHSYYIRVDTQTETMAEPIQSETNRFLFYPTAQIQPVNLISPQDHAGMTLPELDIHWEEPTDCNTIFRYEIQFSEHSNFSDYADRVPSTELDPQTMERRTPNLEVCKLYYWRVMTDPPGDAPPVYSEVRSFGLLDPTQPCPIVIPEITPIPLDHLVITPTSTPVTIPATITALANLNCRSGPGPVYKIDDTLMKGETAPILGRNEEGSWWYILIEDHKKKCWVWGNKATISGNPSDIPILEAPPTPITPVDDLPDHRDTCADYTDEKTCEENSTCKWVEILTSYSASYCEAK